MYTVLTDSTAVSHNMLRRIILPGIPKLLYIIGIISNKTEKLEKLMLIFVIKTNNVLKPALGVVITD